MKSEQELTKSIMRRVYAVYFLRELSQPGVRIALLAFLAFALRALISITSVIENATAKRDVFGFVNYAFEAFVSTEFAVQFVLVAGTLLALYMVKDAAAFLKPQRMAI